MTKKIPNSAVRPVKKVPVRVIKKKKDIPVGRYAKGHAEVTQKLPPVKDILREAEAQKKKYVFSSENRFDTPLVVKTTNGSIKKRKFPLSLFPAKGDTVGECVRKIVFIISFSVMIIAMILIAQYLIENYQNEQRNDYLENIYRTSLTDTDPDSSSRLEQTTDENGKIYYTLIPGAQKLLEINKDVAGYISVPGTDIAYPLMKGEKNNDEYLKTDIYGNSLRAGSIFLDYRCVFDKIENGEPAEKSSDNLIVYGHNMRDESMFGKLKYYKSDPGYYEEHPIIELNSNYFQHSYKIFAIFIADPDDKTDTFFDYWNVLDFNDKDSFYKYVNEIKRRTIRNTNVDIEYGDQLLILSTCSNTVSDGRLVVAARLVRDDEKLYEGTANSSENKNAKMPTSYYGSKGNTYDESKFEPYPEK